ncbi:unnamed protein product (macronuclear) [Paramecium tetraurelia]|uniref:DUF4201 domain-containing protein n=1 Tax=Paramecium tetraurelia TaxID=5888 RepID=A0D1J5_PARTE|nr:uncharacterized protein GSPATT00012436001 [Paramecium tetraurelia]CAK76912.1 unnamed protein product [Paramecium tetraurelia]|eukprot:XP_001444309.1 hypothetical protein (macronuclear) [Paramecium tetraurelia strain d4-2]
MRMNQELEQQRRALKEDYIKFKNKDSNYEDDNYDENLDYDENEFNDVYKDDSDQEQDLQQQQNYDSSEDEDFNNDVAVQQMVNQVRNIKSADQNRDSQQPIKYDDKKQEILEQELIVDEQKKILRMQSLKADALKQELDNILQQNKMKENLIQEIELKGKNIVDQTKKYNAQIVSLNEKYEQFRQKLLEAQQKTKASEKENLAITKEIESVKKEYRKIDAEANKKDIGINRTVEQIQKLKLEQQKNKLSNNDKQSDLSLNIDQFKKDNQRIEQQITESLQALKKQLKLIDILKRQRIHIIAARMFQFIESDFAKTTDLSNKIQY